MRNIVQTIPNNGIPLFFNFNSMLSVRPHNSSSTVMSIAKLTLDSESIQRNGKNLVMGLCN